MKKDEIRTKRDLIAEVEELRGLIARHRETEARLRETEELYRNLADSSPVGLYLLVQGKFHFLNAQFERSTGYRADELIGQDALFMVHPEDRERVRREAIEMLRGKRTSPYEFRTITKDGRIRWILGTVASIPFWGERAVLGNHLDISEQKEARQKLDELKTLEASILDALPVAVIGLRERQIISANRAVETIFGWSPKKSSGAIRGFSTAATTGTRRSAGTSTPSWRGSGSSARSSPAGTGTAMTSSASSARRASGPTSRKSASSPPTRTSPSASAPRRP
jgi:PAS domain S-box-containing protein